MKPQKIFIITETSYSHNDFEGIDTLYRFYNKEIRDEYFKTLLSEKENEGYEIKIDNDNETFTQYTGSRWSYEFSKSTICDFSIISSIHKGEFNYS